MLTKSRRKPTETITMLRPLATARRAPRRTRRWPWVAAAGGLLAVAAALAYAVFAWPRGGASLDPEALVRVHRPAFGTSGIRIRAQTERGRAVPVSLHRDGSGWPAVRVPAGERLSVEVVFRRPGWVSWLAGGEQRLHLELTAPVSHLTTRWLLVRRGQPVRLRFDRAVSELAVRRGRILRLRQLAHPRSTVSLGKLGVAGSVAVRAVARRWERLPAPDVVTWFPPGRSARVLISPRPGSKLGLDTPIRLRFSKPLATALHGKRPTLEPRVPGRWVATDAHTLVFRPSGYGFGLDAHIHVKLPVTVSAISGDRLAPARTLAWRTPTASPLRLQQLLAELGYLPLSWSPAGADPPRTLRSEVNAALRPPPGRFFWRYANIPGSLQRLWVPGRGNVVTRGAVMAFQRDHGLTADGYAGPQVWRTLIDAAVNGARARSGYSYVIVHRTVPQSLTLWHDGQVVLTSPANTGIPVAPTALGTFPVYSHLVSTTMSGTNPDGSHYRDPGVPWVSYFNGGDAIHGFNRASYGTAQSLGCVELPPAQAARVWPYTPVGTLVTIEP